MNVSLTPELEKMVGEKVKSGLYNSASEVVREALRLLREQDELRSARLEELRRDVAAGVAQLERGEGRAFASAQALVDEVRSSRSIAGRQAVSGGRAG